MKSRRNCDEKNNGGSDEIMMSKIIEALTKL